MPLGSGGILLSSDTTCVEAEELDQLNNALQALALQQYAAGAEVTVVNRGLRYVAQLQEGTRAGRQVSSVNRFSPGTGEEL